MQSEFDLIKLTFERQPTKNNKFHLQIKLDKNTFSTGENICMDGVVWLLQKTTMYRPNNSHDQMVKIQIFEGSRPIGQNIMFANKIVSEKARNIEICSQQYGKLKLQYRFLQYIKEESNKIFMARRKSIEAEKQEYQQAMLTSFNNKKLQILKMGMLLFKFGQRLDYPRKLIYIFLNLIFWKNPGLTFIFGAVVSLGLINIRLCLILLGFCLLVGKKPILGLVRKLKLVNVYERIILPEENMVFLQETMDFYIEKYDLVFAAITSEDRTVIVTVLDQLAFVGAYMVLALLIFDISQLAAISIWLVLLLTSPYGPTVRKYFSPFFLYNKKIFKMFLSEVSNKTFLNNIPQISLIKEFYIFEYQRWWINNEWMHPQKYKWSSQQWKVDLTPRKYPPQGWIWLNEWQFVVNNSTDDEGYQYSNDFKAGFQKQLRIKTIRRRKWVRKCIMKTIPGSPIMKKQ